ncbi:MAG: aldo/keto reductase [Candidatus Bathyarchaeota archaeon]|nr:aldo/keto reductase [Candidatus Bathyarchaeota archaeon]
MQYRTVPKNGDKLSVLGFGCMRLPQKGRKIDQERAIKQIRLAIDHGVNYVDTAVPYHGGESETLLGKALQDGYRDKVKIATKLSPFLLNNPEDMPKILESQLEKLQTDHSDYYLLHALDGESWKKMQGFEVLKFLDKAKADGKIVNAGFSFHGGLRDFKEIVDANDWVMCQIQYNFLDENLQAGTAGLKYAASKRLAVMIMEPLRGGVLAGKLPREAKKIYGASGYQRSPAEWALRWVWNHPEVTVVLSGMNAESQIMENLKTAETALPNSMSPNELAVVHKVAAAYKRLMKVPCTGCGYCMPCPQGVNIPNNFNIYNQYNMFDEKIKTRGIYAVMLMGLMSGEPADASLCMNCGKCVTHCPQHIDIPEELKAVKGTLCNWQTKAMMPIIKRMMPKSPAKKD